LGRDAGYTAGKDGGRIGHYSGPRLGKLDSSHDPAAMSVPTTLHQPHEPPWFAYETVDVMCRVHVTKRPINDPATPVVGCATNAGSCRSGGHSAIVHPAADIRARPARTLPNMDRQLAARTRTADMDTTTHDQNTGSHMTTMHPCLRFNGKAALRRKRLKSNERGPWRSQGDFVFVMRGHETLIQTSGRLGNISHPRLLGERLLHGTHSGTNRPSTLRQTTLRRRAGDSQGFTRAFAILGLRIPR